MKEYLKGGIFEASLQIFLLDLLTELYPQRVSKVIIRHRTAINDHFNTLPWIMTLLKMGKA